MLEIPAYNLISEPKLLFSDKDLTATSIHPLEGLLSFGPYSREMSGHNLQDTIRVAAIYPPNCYGVIKRLIGELNSPHQPQERRNYLKPYPGFEQVFRKKLVLLDEDRCCVIPSPTFSNNQLPYITLSTLLLNAISYISRSAIEFDVLYIYLPDAWKAGFDYPPENFDLHDFLKATSASKNIPVQIIREGSATTYRCRCSVAWRLSIATYVKSGGIPWKLNSIEENTAIIGLSYSLRKNPLSNKQEFLTCCSQVFDSDGTGLEFIAYEVDEYQMYGDNPFLSRFEMRRVMQRSLQLYSYQHPRTKLNRVIIHKTTPFKAEEIDGCFDAFPDAQIELLQITQNVPWRAIKCDSKTTISGYPVNRGTYLQLGQNEVLLWTQGVTNLNGKPYYKEGKGIPSPMHIRHFAGSANWFEHCGIIMGLTKMNWNHDSLYDRLPVTLGYASTLANTLKSLPKLSKKPYEFRFFM